MSEEQEFYIPPEEPVIHGLRHSASIGKLVEALAKATLMFGKVEKSAENPYFKSSYADLASLIAATREGLSKNGLAVIQSPGRLTAANRTTVTTILAHSSGEWLRDELEMPVTKADAQGLGSAITYARRYAYQSLLNVAGEEDDDGNAAVGRTQKDRQSSSTDMSTKDSKTINPAQIRAFWSAVKTGGKTEDQVKSYFAGLKISNTENMNKSDFDMCLKWALAPLVPPADLTEKLQESVEVAENHKAMKRLFAQAHSLGVSEEDVKSYSYKKFKVRSMTQLTTEQIGEVEKDISKWIPAEA